MVVRKISQRRLPQGLSLNSKVKDFSFSFLGLSTTTKAKARTTVPFCFPGTKAVVDSRRAVLFLRPRTFVVYVVVVVSRRERERGWSGDVASRASFGDDWMRESHHRCFFCHRMNRRSLDFDRHRRSFRQSALCVLQKRETTRNKKKTSNATTKDDHEDTHGWDLDARRVREQRL